MNFDMRRIWEGLIIVVLAGASAAGASAWAATKVLGEKLERQQSEIAEIKRDLRDLRRDLYTPYNDPSDMLLNDLKARLEASLHDAASVFGDDDLERHVRIALQATALHKRPRTLSATLDLVADQATYPAPDDLGEIGSLDWRNKYQRQPWQSDYPGPAPLASLVETDGERQIRLSPAPTRQQVRALAGKCTLLYRALPEYEAVDPEPDDGPDFTVIGLTDADKDLIILRAQAEACRELAIRSITKPVTLRDGGQSTARNQTPRAMYDALLAEWRAHP